MSISTFSRPLPTVPGKVAGIVEYIDGGHATVQCSVCHNVNTADPGPGGTPAIFKLVVIDRWNFAPDEGVSGHTTYRRCPDCRAARLHPEEVA